MYVNLFMMKTNLISFVQGLECASPDVSLKAKHRECARHIYHAFAKKIGWVKKEKWSFENVLGLSLKKI